MKIANDTSIVIPKLALNEVKGLAPVLSLSKEGVSPSITEHFNDPFASLRAGSLILR
ncbi:MAG: hypothetical protein OXF97_11425 [Nitrospira sp.]|nr:hypothetical protein [Nitrospira sp.]